MSEYTYCPTCSNALEPKEFEGVCKLACPTHECGFVHWDNPTPVVLVLVELDDKYLVTHNIEWPAWKYSLISGFLDSCEDPEQAALREVKEELDLDVRKITPIGTSIYHKLNQLMISYHAICTGKVVLNEEHDSYRLLTLSELQSWEFGAGSIPALEIWFKSRAT